MQAVFNGIISGSAIALLAIAFQVVYLPTGVFFIGLAGIYALAPYWANLALRAEAGWVAAVLVAVLASAILAAACEWGNHARLARRGASDGAQLISSLGIYIVLVQTIALIWGNDPQSLRTGADYSVHVGSAVLTKSQLITAGVAFTVLLGVITALRATDIGLRLRALADNPTQFALLGHNIDAHRLVAFALAGAFAAVSSLLMAHDIGFDPYTGLTAVLLAVVAVIIGGRGSFVGPVVGALLLGVVRTQVVWHISARWQEAVTFGVLALFLILRPQGLFGRQARLEAAP